MILDYNLFSALEPITQEQQWMCVSGAHAIHAVPSANTIFGDQTLHEEIKHGKSDIIICYWK